MIGKTIPHPARTGRFEVVDQSGDIQRGMDANQEMDMIRFAPEFDQRTPPMRKNFCESLAKRIKECWRQGLAPVFGDKHNMQPKRIHRMRS
jgi:hypothetical protein